MSQNFKAGDFLVFQLEAGFALLRLLEIDGIGEDRIWHLAAYDEFFADIDSADAAAASRTDMRISMKHVALTTRAFESTQVARLLNRELTNNETEALEAWRNDPDREVSDRSVRLMLGLR